MNTHLITFYGIKSSFLAEYYFPHLFLDGILHILGYSRDSSKSVVVFCLLLRCYLELISLISIRKMVARLV